MNRIILFFILFFVIKSQENSSILKFSLEEREIHFFNGKSVLFIIFYKPNNFDFLKFQIVPKFDSISSFHNFYFKYDEKPSSNNYNIKFTEQKNPIVYLHYNDENTRLKTNVLIECEFQCKFTLKYQAISKNDLIIVENSFFFINSTKKYENLNVNFVPQNNFDFNNFSQLFIITSMKKNEIDLNVKIDENNFNVEYNLFNGKIFVLNKNNFNNEKKLSLILNNFPSEIIKIENKILNLNKNLIDFRNVNLFEDYFTIFGKNTNFEKSCFYINNNQANKIYFNILTKKEIFIYQTDKNFIENFSEKKIKNSDFFIANLSKSKFFCFKSENSKNEIFSINFQIYDQENLNSNSNKLIPLIREINYKFHLDYNQNIYHRVSSFSLEHSSLLTSIQILTGEIKYFSGECFEFPNCYFKLNESDNNLIKIDLNTPPIINNKVKNGIIINDYFRDPFYSKNQLISIIICKSFDGCDYNIKFNSTNDYYNFLGESSYEIERKINRNLNNKNETVVFKIYDENVKKIYVEMNVLKGEVNFNVFRLNENNSIGKKIFVGNKKIIIIEDENLIGIYFIKIECFYDSFFSLKYYTKNNNNFNSILINNFEYLNIENNENIFFDNLNKKNDFFLYVLSINCLLKIKYKNIENNDENFAQFLIKNETEKIKINIEILNKFSSENCDLFLLANQIEKSIKIYDNIKYSFKIENYSLNFEYFYMKNLFFDSQEIIIKINKKNSENLNILIKNYENKIINNFTIFSFETNKFLIISQKNLENSCLENFDCKLFILVEKNTKNEINFDLEIFGYVNNPIYLKPNQIYKEFLKEEKIYLLNIKKKTKGEINIFFNYGLANAIASITNETQIDSKLINKIKNDKKNNFFYDFNSKKIVFDYDKIECENQCKLIILIYYDFKFSTYFNTKIEFNLFVKIENEKFINVFEEEKIFGEIFDKNYYKIKINKNINKFFIDFNSFNCNFLIKRNEIVNEKNKDFEIKIKNNFFEINYNNENLFNNIFYILINSNENNNNENLNYDFKIIFPSNENFIFHKIFSIYEENCVFINNECFFMIPIKNYFPKIKDFFIYVFNEDSNENYFEIYANLINEENIENNKNVFDYFPNKKNFDFKNENNENFLNIENKKIDLNNKNKFIFIYVYSNEKKMKLIFDFISKSNVFLNKNGNLIYKNDKNEKINFFNFGENFINYEIFLLKGKSNFEIFNEENFNLNEKNKIILTKKLSNNFNENKIIFSLEKNNFDFIIFIKTYSIKNYNKIEKLNENKNFLIRENFNENFFPIFCYNQILENSLNLIINNNINIYDEKIEIKIFLTDENSIKNKIKNFDSEIKIFDELENFYNKYTKNHIFWLKNSFKSNEKKFLFIEIKNKNNINLNSIKNANFIFNNFYSNSFSILPKNEYLKININGKIINNFILEKDSLNSAIKLEFSRLDENYNFVINFLDDINKIKKITNFNELKNNSQINKYLKKSYGKKILKITKLFNKNGIILSFFKNDFVNENYNNFIIIKYLDYEYSKNIYNNFYIKNEKINIKINNNKININFSPILSKEKTEIFSVDYIINIFDANKIINRNSFFEISPNFTKKLNNFTKCEINIEKLNNFYVKILGVVDNGRNLEKLFYNIVDKKGNLFEKEEIIEENFDPDDVQKEEKNDAEKYKEEAKKLKKRKKNNFKLIIVIIIVCLLLILFYIRKKIKLKKENNVENQMFYLMKSNKRIEIDKDEYQQVN